MASSFGTHLASQQLIRRSRFGSGEHTPKIEQYFLSNKHGDEVVVTNFGATIISIKVPDRDGRRGDIVLGHDTLEDYEHGHGYMGATIGRYANRIANGQFCLNGIEHQLTRNAGRQHLHGGKRGFSHVPWRAWPLVGDHGCSLRLRYRSNDGEEGYPGNLNVYVTFAFNDNRELTIEYEATTDKDTIVNLTNHSYFNLQGSGDILDHELTLAAEYFVPVNPDMIPTGGIKPVEGTPFDFRQRTRIGSRIDCANGQLRLAGGYDHTWVIEPSGENTLRHAANLYDPSTGRHMEVWTTEPGIQFYSGNHLNGAADGKQGTSYEPSSGLCLETQHFPDSPNHGNFPNTVLKAGHTYNSATIYKFSAF